MTLDPFITLAASERCSLHLSRFPLCPSMLRSIRPFSKDDPKPCYTICQQSCSCHQVDARDPVREFYRSYFLMKKSHTGLSISCKVRSYSSQV